MPWALGFRCSFGGLHGGGSRPRRLERLSYWPAPGLPGGAGAASLLPGLWGKAKGGGAWA